MFGNAINSDICFDVWLDFLIAIESSAALENERNSVESFGVVFETCIAVDVCIDSNIVVTAVIDCVEPVDVIRKSCLSIDGDIVCSCITVDIGIGFSTAVDDLTISWATLDFIDNSDLALVGTSFSCISLEAVTGIRVPFVLLDFVVAMDIEKDSSVIVGDKAVCILKEFAEVTLALDTESEFNIDDVIDFDIIADVSKDFSLV